jgi:hypothetical protein
MYGRAMALQRIELHLPLVPSRREIRIDGFDISNAVSAVTLRADVRDVPILELTLPIDATVEGDAYVVIPKATRELLRRMGWTAPE